MSKITLNTLRKMKQQGEKIAALTAYDATFANILENAGVEILLVGDTLGMVIQGHDTTLPVSVDNIIYHTQAVRRGLINALIIADMPFMSDANPELALENAGRIMKEGGAHVVKLEGGEPILETVARLAGRGVPVCAHLGLLPQSINKLGSYKVQGRDEQTARKLVKDAKAMQEAGADLMVLECVPQSLAAEVTETLDIPIIGIGAGPQCDGQVLVLQDMLGLSTQLKPRFAKDFLKETGSVQKAAEAYVKAVKAGDFPAQEHSFK